MYRYLVKIGTFIGFLAVSSAAEVTLSGILYTPYSNTPAICSVAIKGPTKTLPLAAISGSTELIPAYKRFKTDATGAYSFSIQPNNLMNPTGTYYYTEYSCAGVTWNEWWQVTSAATVIADVRVTTTPTSTGGSGGSSGSFTSPLTTPGDTIVVNSGGATIRLGSITDYTCSGPLTLTNAATIQRFNMTANCVLTFPAAGIYPGQQYIVRLAQDASGGRTVGVSSNVHGFMVVSTGANTVSVQDFFWDDVKALWYARNTGVQNQ